jgi:predicted phage terminase large subunit-like protein
MSRFNLDSFRVVEKPKEIDLKAFHNGLMGYFESKENYLKPPEFHNKIFDLYENEDRLQLVVAPVGFAKSTTLRNYALYKLLSGTKLQLYVSSSASKVAQHFSSFSKFLTSKSFQMAFQFELVNCNTEKVVIKINGQNRAIYGVSASSDISGINFEGTRPDLILIDDLEELDQANSIDRTEALIDWVDMTLLSRLPSLVRGKVRMIGTNLSLNSICNRLLTGEKKGWSAYLFQALDAEGKSIWEERHPAEALKKLRQDNPSVFARNYMNSPLDNKTSLIHKDDLRYWEFGELDVEKDIDKIYIHADTTHTAKTVSDYFCLVALGRHRVNKNYYVLDFVLDKVEVEKQAKLLSKFYKLFNGNVNKITFDEKANQGFGYWAKKVAREELGISLPLEELKFSGDKVKHLEPYIPHFKNNRVYLPKWHKDLVLARNQLLAFPSGSVNDDFVDGLVGALQNFPVIDNEIIEYEEVGLPDLNRFQIENDGSLFLEGFGNDF